MHQSNKIRILEFVREYYAVHGMAPEQRDIARGVGCSLNCVFKHLKQLVIDGSLLYKDGKYIPENLGFFDMNK